MTAQKNGHCRNMLKTQVKSFKLLHQQSVVQHRTVHAVLFEVELFHNNILPADSYRVMRKEESIYKERKSEKYSNKTNLKVSCVLIHLTVSLYVIAVSMKITDKGN